MKRIISALLLVGARIAFRISFRCFLIRRGIWLGVGFRLFGGESNNRRPAHLLTNHKFKISHNLGDPVTLLFEHENFFFVAGQDRFAFCPGREFVQKFFNRHLRFVHTLFLLGPVLVQVMFVRCSIKSLWLFNPVSWEAHQRFMRLVCTLFDRMAPRLRPLRVLSPWCNKIAQRPFGLIRGFASCRG